MTKEQRRIVKTGIIFTIIWVGMIFGFLTGMFGNVESQYDITLEEDVLTFVEILSCKLAN